MYGRHRLLFFFLEVTGLILLLAALFPYIAGPYASSVARLADITTPSSIIIQAQEDTFLIFLKGYPLPSSLHALPFFGGFILLLALVLFTPGIPVKKRPVYLVVALSCSIAIQVVSLAAIGLIAYFNAERWLGRSIATLFLSIGIDLFPVLIWAIVSYKYWLPVLYHPGLPESISTGGES
jgi:hypothetical protein